MIQHSQCGCGPSKTPCGCCAGTEVLTPAPIINLPGRSKLAYRVGTHATFFETMLARLSTMCLGTDEECRAGGGLRPQLQLTTRDVSDPSIALLDAWATVADALTFYQERIANEGYLRTAIERRSIIELARLVGYKLRPGVTASVYLALTIDDNETVVAEPFQVRAQSVPGPGELPQSFENIETIEARGRWNKLTPRMLRPQNLIEVRKQTDERKTARLYLKGITTGLNQGDPLLVVLGPSEVLLRIIDVKTDAAADRTQVLVQMWTVITGASGINRGELVEIINNFKNAGIAKPHLDALSKELAAGRSSAELADFIELQTLPALEKIGARRNVSKALRDRARLFSEELGGKLNAIRQSAAIAGANAAPADPSNESPVVVNDPKTTDAERENDTLRSLVDGLTKPPSVPPRNNFQFAREAASAFQLHSDVGIQTLGVFQPTILSALPVALGNTGVERLITPEVYAFRVKSAPFGHNAPLSSEIKETQSTNGATTKSTKIQLNEWTADDVHKTEDFFLPPGASSCDTTEVCKVIYLDGTFDKILPQSWMVVDTGAIQGNSTRQLQLENPPLLIARAAKSETLSRGAYGLTGKATRIELAGESGVDEARWLRFAGGNNPTTTEFQIIRRTVVYAQAELLPLTEEPIEEEICTTEENEGWIRLDGVYSELKSGRWVIVAGERADVLDGLGTRVTGVKGTELAMLAEVIHDVEPGLPGDTQHTRIKFAQPLEYCYARDKITIYANVVKATHGESRNETLGNGDGSKSLQQFALKQPPLTYVSAVTPSGVESTLKLFVNDVEWHEAKSIYGLGPIERRFVTTRNDAEVTSVIFGNGKQGARLPTGLENVRAKYRQGLGQAGNVADGKISLLAARPLHVKEVINPQKASGGADPETADQARRNTPLAVLALDRLVSTSDYADFARTFGGIGKAFSVRMSDGIRELVHVTIAGAGDAPIQEDSEVLRNLRLALREFGDPSLPLNVAVRELLMLVISADVGLLPDRVWEKVAPQIRSRLLDTFSFERRDIGQDVYLSEVISTIQSVPGVAYVDVNAFGGVSEKNEDGTVRTPNELTAALNIATQHEPDSRIPLRLPQLPGPGVSQILPAQLAYLVPEVPDTLIINWIH